MMMTIVMVGSTYILVRSIRYAVPFLFRHGLSCRFIYSAFVLLPLFDTGEEGAIFQFEVAIELYGKKGDLVGSLNLEFQHDRPTVVGSVSNAIG